MIGVILLKITRDVLATEAKATASIPEQNAFEQCGGYQNVKFSHGISEISAGLYYIGLAEGSNIATCKCLK
jgi:hypothetical protein